MRFALILSLLASLLCADISFRDRRGRLLEIRIANQTSDFLPAKKMFVDSFFSVYREMPPRLFNPRFRKPKHIRWMLEEAFDYEVRSFLVGANTVITGWIDGQPVSFLSFSDTVDADSIWVNQFAVSAAEQRAGLGTLTLLALVEDPDLRPQLQTLSLTARRVNRPALSFYRKLGFVPSEDLSEFIEHDRFQQLTLFNCDEVLRSLRP